MARSIEIQPEYHEGVFRRWVRCKDGMYRMDYVHGYAVENVDNAVDFIDFYVYQHEKGLWTLCDVATGATIGGELFNMPSRDRAVRAGLVAMRRWRITETQYKASVALFQEMVSSQGIPNNLPVPTLEVMRVTMENRRAWQAQHGGTSWQ